MKSKDNQFSALQYSKTSKKYSLTAYSIFNAAQLTKESLTERIAFYNQPETYNFFENRTENNKGIFGTTQIKARCNFTENTFLYYNFGYNRTSDRFNQNINRDFSSIENNIEVVDDSKQNSMINYLSFNTLLDKNTKVILDFSQNQTSLSKDLNFISNIGLFGTNSNYLNQYFALDTNQYATNFYLQNKNRFINFNFQSGFTYSRTQSENIQYQIETSDEQKIDSYHYMNSLSLSKQFQQWNFSGALDWHFLTINQKDQNYFEKNLKIKFRPDTKITQEYSIEYHDRFENPNLKLLQSIPLYDQNISYSINRNLLVDDLSHYDSYKFTYRRFNINKGNIWLLMMVYDTTSDVFTTNNMNYGMYSVYENVGGKMKDRWLGLLSNETRIKPYLALKTKLTVTENNAGNYIRNKENTTEIQNFEINQQLSSNFKKFPIQFDLGYIYTHNTFNQSLYQTKSSQENMLALLGARTHIKKELTISILGEYLFQKTAIQTQRNFLLGGKFTYKKEQSNIEFNLRFNNILNLDNFNYINNRATEMGTEYTNIAALKGYVIGGMKFNF